jgi:hypothetical protein
MGAVIVGAAMWPAFGHSPAGERTQIAPLSGRSAKGNFGPMRLAFWSTSGAGVDETGIGRAGTGDRRMER